MSRSLAMLAALAAPPFAWAEAPAVAAARAALDASVAAERTARAELERERRAGLLSGRALEDFEDYLADLVQAVAARRAELDRLLAGTLPVIAAPAAFEYARVDTASGRLSRLDDQLDAALGDFDEMLLREQELLASRARRETSDGGAAGGAAGQQGQAGQQGAAGQPAGLGQPGAHGRQGGTPGEQGRQVAGIGQPGRAGTGRSEESLGQLPPLPGGAQAPADESGEDRRVAKGLDPNADRGHGAYGGTPPDIPDGKDDDIVARQIREAAERERDPALREKLWDEYRKYKTGGR